MANYTYSIQNDFPNQILSSDRLTQEIESSTITIALDNISTSGDDCIVAFKASLSNDEQTTLDELVAIHSGADLDPLPTTILVNEPKDANGFPINVLSPRSGNETIYCSSNFCDKCTWYGGSVRVTEEVLTSNDGYTWSSANTFWVDMASGRVLDDDGIADEQRLLNPGDPHGYQVVVTVDNVEKTCRDHFATSGGDYEVYFEDGYIKSTTDWTGSVVKCSYSYADDSVFILAPLPGYTLNIEAAESDFTTDVVMNDCILYEVKGLVDVFAPELMPGVPSGTKITLLSNKYKRLGQILTEAIGSFPTIKSLGVADEHKGLSLKEIRRQSRGVNSDFIAVPFRYATMRSLNSAYGLELHVKLENNNVFGGSHCSLTLYCTSKQN